MKFPFTFKYTFILYLILLLQSNAKAQFYFSDVLSNLNTNKLYQTHQKNKIKTVTVKNVLKDIEDEYNKFQFQLKYSKNWQEQKTIISLPNGGERMYTSTFDLNKIIRKDDDGLNINSLIRYDYDNKNRLLAIRTSAVDTSVQDGFFEKHIFVYDSSNLPIKMYKIKNSTDTTVVEFIKDETKNIGEERWYKKGALIETYYYYYNDKNLLTDIVRFNAKYEKMLPEFIFEYDENNNVTKQIQIPFGGNKYTGTNYEYDNRGLKTMESIFTKKGELLNKVEYSYEF